MGQVCHVHLVFVHGVFVHGSESEWPVPSPRHTDPQHPRPVDSPAPLILLTFILIPDCTLTPGPTRRALTTPQSVPVQLSPTP